MTDVIVLETNNFLPELYAETAISKLFVGCLKCVNTKWYEFGVGLSVYQLIACGGVFWETV